MGLRDIEKKLKSKSAFQVQDAEMILQELDGLIQNVEVLKRQLKKFEKKHGNQIKENKDYYQKVAFLRSELGLPEEVGVYEWRESPSFMDRLKGSGYFDQLGNEILELSNEVKSSSGGLISVAELVLKINKKRPGKLVPVKDLVRSLKSLEEGKIIQPLRKLESGVLIVEFVAIELSSDQQDVFNLASQKGFLTVEKLIMDHGWNQERALRVLNELVEKGITLKDETYHEGTKYWFPSLGQ